ncbi:MAG: CaiB/BaiF CoA transferase family protein [Burkholderiales bacterium]|jgi:crotonobetainyl-CoA:carnitine CoA-transferase CaiB-like acyl-CoA transferase
MTDPKAFAGIRVLDFTHVLAGPYATSQIAMQGADVIKIEPRTGDGMRLTPVSREWSERGLGPAWMAVNANKRSLTLDLAKEEAKRIVFRLAESADVVVSNFRPGVMDKLGIGWEALSAINPKLIYVEMSGFGSTGPERRTASFDGKIQAMSGLMTLTGETVNGPMRAGFAAADVATGITGAFAIATALFQRTHTGRGQFVDVAMLDSMMGFLNGQIAEWLNTGYRHPQYGNRSVSMKPTADRFRCGEGFIVLAVLTEPQFQRLLTTLGRADALADPRFADWFTRMEHDVALREVIEGAFADGTPEQWVARLTEADVPCARVTSLPEIVTHPQLAHRGYLQQAETPYGPVTLAGPAFRFQHGNGGIDRPLATLGMHTEEVLTELGYDAAAITALREAEVI